MSVISRRQKDILLSDVQRMINNNNHTAFANHAKIAERVSNGDLTFYIDSPKKEFVIKYGNKEIRFNCNDQQMSELKSIKFDDNSVIKGISDSITSDSSNIALSTKWDKTVKNDFDNHNHDQQYAPKNHNHDQQYAAKDHNHDSDYAPINHTHATQYSPATHTHSISNITNLQNTLDNKANVNHTHFGIDSKDKLIEFIQDHKNSTWDYVFTGLKVAGTVYEGLTIVGMQSEISALMASVSALTGVSGVGATSGIGTTLFGLKNTMEGIANCTQNLGNKFESIKGATDTMAQYINKGANYVGKAQKAVDGFFNNITGSSDLYQALPDMMNVGHQVGGPGIDIATAKLPSALNVMKGMASSTIAA